MPCDNRPVTARRLPAILVLLPALALPALAEGASKAKRRAVARG